MLFSKNFQMLNEKESLRKYCDDELFQEAFNQAYRAAIPSLFTQKADKIQALEKMVAKNLHIFEFDTNNELKYLLGFRSEDKDITICLSVIYVNQKYRRKGVAIELINRLKADLNNKDIVFVASASANNTAATNLLYSLGFRTPIDMDEPDYLGAQYVDFFWSKHKFDAERVSRHLQVKILN
jgi:GNAT superfamily N-acetyltransferase